MLAAFTMVSIKTKASGVCVCVSDVYDLYLH